jgi:hypothetical protein
LVASSLITSHLREVRACACRASTLVTGDRLDRQEAMVLLAHAVDQLAAALDTTMLTTPTFRAICRLRDRLDAHVVAARALDDVGSALGAQRVLTMAVGLVLDNTVVLAHTGDMAVGG